MIKSKKVRIIALVTAIGLIIVLSFTTIQGDQKTYEVQPQISLPGYGGESSRLLDAYERLMERYMDMVDKNLTTIDADIKNTAKKIDSIDARLTELCERTVRIEKALGIEQSKQPIKKLPPAGKTNIN
ncbi:MAG: hypothetical protein JW715_08805 [Sedimentisphaerales bacterium]|nr:hypothetical protein [Sedimentisphaerales bacterium]